MPTKTAGTKTTSLTTPSRTKTKIYVAAPWVKREEAKKFRDQLVDRGFEVTSRWLDQHGDSKDPLVLRHEAQHDWADVEAADVLVVLNLCKSEGKATEQGLALQLGKHIIGVGKPMNNVFHYLPQYVWVDDIVGVVNHLNDPNAGF